MEGVVPLLALLLLLVIAAFVSAPVRSWLFEGRAREEGGERRERLEALRAERTARLRELADAELDFRSGKLEEQAFLAMKERLGREVLALDQALRDGGLADLEEGDRVAEKEDREDDRPAVEVSLQHRSAAKRSRPAADPEGAGQA